MTSQSVSEDEAGETCADDEHRLEHVEDGWAARVVRVERITNRFWSVNHLGVNGGRPPRQIVSWTSQTEPFGISLHYQAKKPVIISF